MSIIVRILLYVFCITTAAISTSQAAEITPVENFEVLEKTYVKINADASSPSDLFNINKFLESSFNKIRENYYSLLNWRILRRSPDNLTIPDYDRKAMFGSWINNREDDSCYNTRAIVLIRDSYKKVGFEEDNCTVKEGHWKDDYTGRVFTKREEIQIDHVVALKNAYMSGAHRWGFRSRCLYANFLGNQYHLKSVNASENMRKGDKAPDRYMPPNKEHTCEYLKNWLSIKFTWGLRMTESEALSISNQIAQNKCNLRQFYISASEIEKQKTFFKENIDLCDHVLENNTAPVPDTEIL